jgi:hypothetical protein
MGHLADGSLHLGGGVEAVRLLLDGTNLGNMVHWQSPPVSLTAEE